MITVYGIPNCNSIKKTLKWLKNNQVDYQFHDYKKSGITRDKLSGWCREAGWENVLNKKGTTWKKLSLSEQEKITNAASAIKMMMEHNSMIKRPVIETGKSVLVGYNEEVFLKTIK